MGNLKVGESVWVRDIGWGRYTKQCEKLQSMSTKGSSIYLYFKGNGIVKSVPKKFII
jgi:hypothetical protein